MRRVGPLALGMLAGVVADAQAQQFVQGVPYAIHADVVCFSFAADVVDQSTGAKIAGEYYAIPMRPSADPTARLDQNPAEYLGHAQAAAVVRDAFRDQRTVYFEINVPVQPVNSLTCATPFSGQQYNSIPMARHIEMKNEQ